jgi:hypothetical protein
MLISGMIVSIGLFCWFERLFVGLFWTLLHTTARILSTLNGWSAFLGLF